MITMAYISGLIFVKLFRVLFNFDFVEKKKSPNQLRRDQLRIGKFIQKKKETGTPETVVKLTNIEILDDSVSKSEVQYVTGEWHKAPEDSKTLHLCSNLL